MSRRWVINASPLIILAKVAHISLISEMCEEVIVPAGVAQEIDQGPENDPARSWLNGEGSALIKREESIAPIVTAWDLGLGESQVLSLAYTNPGYEVIIDDRAARNCALSLRIPVRGTLGVILLAKKEGLVSKVSPILNQLLKAGLRIDHALLKAALQLVNE